MKWRGDGVWYGIVVLGVQYSALHSTEIRFLLDFNSIPVLSVLYILHFLTTLVAIFGQINY